ncbi:MAG: hypothetical protein JWN72_2817, partial [Thermoleophilia bacterium]|nr:hypothetical protein [Thermoleophilia bacterium]
DRREPRSDAVQQPGETLNVSYDLAMQEGWLTVLATRAGYAHRRGTNFPSRPWSVAELEAEGYELVRSSGSAGLVGHCSLILRREGLVAEVEGDARGGLLQLRVCGASPLVADAACAWFDEALRENRLPREETRVPIHFWTMSAQGPRPMRMMIEAPTWTEIAANYAPEIRDELARTMQVGRTDIEGVALWRGAPGTGKTTALRALAMEWANWCDVHVIVDPEVFLGDQASYLMDVLFSFQDPHTAHLNAMMAHHLAGGGIGQSMGVVQFSSGDDDYGDNELDGFAGDDGFHERTQRQSLTSRAKLIVLEDAGELVTAGARANAGQALSRLLNISDGMLGQGANISVLITTNEELGNLHPAIQRPGRAWSQVEFDAFEAAAATAWLADRGITHAASSPVSLAELYAIERAARPDRGRSLDPDV